MEFVRFAIVVFLACVQASVVPNNEVDHANCRHLFAENLSPNFNETIAHSIHSMTVQGLEMFNPRATEFNTVPTINHDISDEDHLVLPYAPEDHVTNDFITQTMNVIDVIMSRIGKDDDGLGPNWSSTERIVHKFHMYDVWKRVLETYKETVAKHPPKDNLCKCLLDTTENGIHDAVLWVAKHYKSGVNLFSLLKSPLPKLKDASSWPIWKKRLLHYYKQPALYDSSVYLYCATKHF